jgi:hypothetical protein
MNLGRVFMYGANTIRYFAESKQVLEVLLIGTADSGFCPLERVVRADPVHGKSRIYLRADILVPDRQ